MDNFNYINRPTCSLKVGTKFESFSNAALGVHWKCSLDVVHLDSPWCVWTFPKQSIDENLWKYKRTHHAISYTSQMTFTTSQSAIMSSPPGRSGLRVSFFQSYSITQREVMRLQSIALSIQLTWRKSLAWMFAFLEFGPGTSNFGHSWPTVKIVFTSRIWYLRNTNKNNLFNWKKTPYQRNLYMMLQNNLWPYQKGALVHITYKLGASAFIMKYLIWRDILSSCH